MNSKQAIQLIFILVILILFPTPGEVSAQTSPPAIINIYSPHAGEAVQGFISITGAIQASSQVSYRLEFSFMGQPEGGWFLIQEGTTPIVDQLIGGWDTSAITDGDYRLRVIVAGSEGTAASSSIDGIRVRNYTAIETNTPAPEGEITDIPDPTATLQPTETPALAEENSIGSKNPASFSANVISAALKIGGITGALIFLAYLLIRWAKISRD